MILQRISAACARINRALAPPPAGSQTHMGGQGKMEALEDQQFTPEEFEADNREEREQ
jgi:hypothetical protein